MKAFSTPRAPGYLPFITQAMSARGLLFTAAIPREPESLEIPGSFGEQVRLTMKNLGAVLEAAGLDFDNLVKVNVYLSDIANWSEFNEIYQEFINLECPPMRCAVQIAGLNNGYLIELDVIAEHPEG